MNWRWWRKLRSIGLAEQTPRPIKLAEIDRLLVERCVAAITDAGSPWYGQVLVDGRWLIWSGPYDLLGIELEAGLYTPIDGLPEVYYSAPDVEGMMGLALGPQSRIRATLWPAREAGV